MIEDKYKETSCLGKHIFPITIADLGRTKTKHIRFGGVAFWQLPHFLFFPVVSGVFVVQAARRLTTL